VEQKRAEGIEWLERAAQNDDYLAGKIAAKYEGVAEDGCD
jgi:hypothetical protein